MKRGDWFFAAADPKLVFEADRAKLWDLVWALREMSL